MTRSLEPRGAHQQYRVVFKEQKRGFWHERSRVYTSLRQAIKQAHRFGALRVFVAQVGPEEGFTLEEAESWSRS